MSEGHPLRRVSAEEYNELRRTLSRLEAEAAQKLGAAREKLQRKAIELERHIGQLEKGKLVDGLPPDIEDTGAL